MKFQTEIVIGKVEGLYKTREPENFVTEAVDRLFFSLEGIEGDRHGGFTRKSGGREKKYYPKNSETRNNRQWSAVSLEEMSEIEKAMGKSPIQPEWLGANLLISGIPAFSKLPLLTHFQMGEDGPCFVLFEHNGPCSYPDEEIKAHLGSDVKQSFPKAAKNIRGLVGWVDKAGWIGIGDEVRVLIPKVEA